MRGTRLKVQVFRQYIFDRADFITDAIDKLVTDTARTKRPNTKKRGMNDGASDIEVIGIATSVLTSLNWLVNLSYNLYMISFLQNYPEVTQFSTSQNCSQPIEHN